MDNLEDATVEVDEEDDRQPSSIQNHNPEIFQYGVRLVIYYIQNYGWGVIFALIFGGWFIKFIQRKMATKAVQSRTGVVYDDETFLNNQEAMMKARLKMQEEITKQSREKAELLKKREEEKLNEKVDDWERHLRGQSYKSKAKARLLIEDVNPLAPSSSITSSFRPAGRQLGRGG